MTDRRRLLEIASRGLFDRALVDGTDFATKYLELSASGDAVVPSEQDGRPLFLINTPTGAEHVLETHADGYDHPQHPYKELEGRLAPTGSMLLRFGAPEPQRTIARTHREVVAAAADGGRALVEASDGGPVDLELELKALFLRLMVRLLFDVETDGLARPFARAIHYLEECWVKKRRVPADRERWLSEEEERLYGWALEIRDLLADHVIRRAGLETPAGRTPEDLRYAIADTLLNGYVALAETACWTLYRLARHEEVRSGVQEEIDRQLGAGSWDDAGTFRELRRSRSAISETLRLYPPAWVVGRRAVRADRVEGVEIPADSHVVVSPLAMHRHPGLWDDPLRFRPERFEPQRVRARHRYAYLPFGGGPRRCPAGPPALSYLQTVLAVLLYAFDVAVEAAEDLQPRALVSLRPHPAPTARFSERRPIPRDGIGS